MNRKFKPNRQGITLLFVISMIVLFLLMGTAFVIVSNDFNRESVRRIQSNQHEGKGPTQGNQLLDEVISTLIRGTSLLDVDSPLRTNDILADQYGYGVRAYVSSDAPPSYVGGVGTNSPFVDLVLTSDPDVAAANNECFNLLTLSTTPADLSPNDLNGTFGGRVLSFTSGPAKGFSVRIVADAFNGSGNLVFRIPTSSVSGDVIDLSATELASLLPGSEVIINGRDFSGSGADAVFTAGEPTSLGPESQLPNRAGQTHAALLAYLNSPNSVNEPWDAADIATPFLAGFDINGNLIPSFYRQRLMDNVADSATGSRQFHAFDQGNDGIPDVDTDGDGTPDSFWMDLGMPIVTNAAGQRYRPLFAIHIRDLDGLLNVNAHSNSSHLDPTGFVSTQDTWADGEPNAPRGLGMGPAEINLSNAIGNGSLLTLLNERYGDDMVPGDSVNDASRAMRSRAKLFGHPIDVINPGSNNYGTVGGLYSTSMDIFGRFRIGSPQSSNSSVNDFSDPNYPNLNNALPQINMLATANPGASDFLGNPYEMSLNGKSPGDNPFTLQELERLLRPNDIDSRLLPERLWSITKDTGNSTLFTTDSFDVPMLHRGFVDELNRILTVRAAGLTEAERTDLINIGLSQQLAFAPELYFGLKMDVNRPFGDGIDDDNPNDSATNTNGVVDEPGEEAAAANVEAEDVFAGATAAETRMDLNYSGARDANDAAPNSNPRVIFARNLYMLAMLLLEPVDLDGDGSVATDEELQFAQTMAQWAVNVVDFRDPDSIHTRFVYDPNPFNAQGWNPVFDTNNGGVITPAPFAVWGCERPELLLTETLAVHIQNMEPENNGNSYEQRLRPEPFAYFEVYNPWTQNRLNQQFPRELSNATGDVLLGKMAGDSPVWRFEVERADSANTTGFKPLRYVYMANPTGSAITYDDNTDDQVASDIEVFFGTGNAVVSPGSQALIGTRGFEDPNNADFFQLFMGRKTLADDATGNPDDILLDETTRLALNADTRTVTRYTGSTLDSTRQASILFIDQSTTGSATGTAVNRKFSLSDRYQGYPDVDISGAAMTMTEINDGDGFIYTAPYPNSLDEQDGDRITAADIAMIRSQDGINKNFRYVRLQRLANPLIEWDAITNPYLTIDSMEVDLVSINGAAPTDPSVTETPIRDYAVSHERGDDTRTLWGHQRDVAIRTGNAADSVDHHFAEAFTESLGRTNDVFDPNNANSQPFAWLTWNNRPFVSHMEIMNVPYLAPDRLTYAPETSTATFSTDDGTLANPFTDRRMPDAGVLAGRYGHLLNFFGGEADSAGTNSFADAYKLLDFLEVPSRFVGTESWYLANGVNGVLKHPFNSIPHYRVPGKININTIPPTLTDPPTSTSSVVWNALTAEYGSTVDWATLKEVLYGTSTTSPTDFINPFRPAEAINLVPGGPASFNTLPGSFCTLLRPGASGDPLLDYNSANASDNTQRSAAFRNGFRTRLGNMVTTKSSVFAGWITVGYFQVDETDALLANGVEIGAESGEQVRNRAFFIFDRSIPVAYEPGKNHNIDKAIRVKTIIE